MNYFVWKWIPSVGRSGGILGGLGYLYFAYVILPFERFHIKVTLMDLKLQVKWNLVIVYGAAQLEDKEDFLAELINVCQ
jgi:hypothetical protein